MKVFVLAAIVIGSVYALTNEQKAALNAISKDCQKQSGVSQELIEKARKGELVDDPKLKVQMFCVSKKAGLATDAGQINKEALKIKVKKVSKDDAEADALVTKCAVNKASPEETAFEVFKCLYKEKPNFSVV